MGVSGEVWRQDAVELLRDDGVRDAPSVSRSSRDAESPATTLSACGWLRDEDHSNLD